MTALSDIDSSDIIIKPGNNNISRLEGLKQPVHILNHIYEGKALPDILRMCDGDSGMLESWLNFMTSFGWIEKVLDDGNERMFIVTEKGKDTLQRYYP
jgi:hypothetical protein